MQRSLHAAVAAASIVLLTQCTTRLASVEHLAREAGFASDEVLGEAFEHRVFRPDESRVADTLNVYLEGDGSPYRSPLVVNEDPTPAHPVMLRLMALDPGLAVYVGRPCYFGLTQSSGCGPRLWTNERFSESVVASLEAAVRKEMARAGARRVRLYGHSGGGALAVLVARRLGPTVVTEVITLAGNLDHSAWTTHHGYAPLVGSLNPVDGGELPKAIRQLHLFGADDQNIPAAVMRKAAEEDLGGQSMVVPGIRHTCCWEQIWPAVLSGQTLNQRNDVWNRIPEVISANDNVS